MKFEAPLPLSNGARSAEASLIIDGKGLANW